MIHLANKPVTRLRPLCTPAPRPWVLPKQEENRCRFANGNLRSNRVQGWFDIWCPSFPSIQVKSCLIGALLTYDRRVFTTLSCQKHSIQPPCRPLGHTQKNDAASSNPTPPNGIWQMGENLSKARSIRRSNLAVGPAHHGRGRWRKSCSMICLYVS